jgi:hypothetical protein
MIFQRFDQNKYKRKREKPPREIAGGHMSGLKIWGGVMSGFLVRGGKANFCDS